MKINYDKKMQESIENLNSTKEKLLLHVCCAPCSSAVLERLKPYFLTSVYFYNPNMDTEDEFNRRAKEAERFITKSGLAEECVIIPYRHEEYLSKINGLESEPEGGGRCERCFRLRLENAARYAKEHGFLWFTTTLTISPHKNADLLNELGKEIAETYGVNYLESDFKKRNGYLRSIELAKEYELYRQDYCGCEFSLRAKE
ncbi:MAG: epoxyqueuosine reductase QueH [Eubacteriales bacterium]|nr:epoxyqueuosine reductase QueH [Eubacteriales bacterium]